MDRAVYCRAACRDSCQSLGSLLSGRDAADVRFLHEMSNPAQTPVSVARQDPPRLTHKAESQPRHPIDPESAQPDGAMPSGVSFIKRLHPRASSPSGVSDAAWVTAMASRGPVAGTFGPVRTLRFNFE